jgi:hypothetical protein
VSAPHSISDSDLDNALHRLAQSEPAADLSLRVMRAVQHRATARPRRAWSGWVPVASVLAALVVLVVMASTWMRQLSTSLAPLPAAPVFRMTQALEAPLVPTGVTHDRPAVVSSSRAPRQRTRSLEAAWVHALPLLEPPSPIQLEDIDTAPLPTDRITIEPLVIGQLEVRPLEP